MYSLIFFVSGLAVLLFGAYVKRRHSSFISECITCDGQVVGFTEETWKTKDGLGYYAGTVRRNVPVIEYHCGQRYQFEGDTDTRYHDLRVGTSVTVYVNRNNPKIARLKISSRETIQTMNIIMLSGLCGVIPGVYLFDSDEFSQLFLMHPLILILISACLMLLFVKMQAVLDLFRFGPLYVENAREVDTFE